MGSLDAIRLKAVALLLVACKRKAPRSKGDTSGVSAKGPLMLKPPLGGCHLSLRSSDGGHKYGLVPVQVVSTSQSNQKAKAKTKTRTDGVARTLWGRQHRLGSNCGRGSIARTSTTRPNGDLLEVHEES
ncbi:hypothetical protein TIFTF001_017251 [Ficus carica]|uniref:Uncharacterized protein n=1 Tax=Ficus carica TaxID=3494 RepID=A0AA88A980_FICCA|nr:hypothetical protein TIFTF001_017251 [Ficus carica]